MHPVAGGGELDGELDGETDGEADGDRDGDTEGEAEADGGVEDVSPYRMPRPFVPTYTRP